MGAVQKTSLTDVPMNELFAVDGGFPVAAPAAAGAGAMAGTFVLGVAGGLLAAFVYDRFLGQKTTATCNDTSASADNGGTECDCTTPAPTTP
jgi:hypothetical protein